jgi:hypothetical protein
MPEPSKLWSRQQPPPLTKAIGGAVGSGGPAVQLSLQSLSVLMTPPQNIREWTVGLVSTVVRAFAVALLPSSTSSYTTGRF